MRDAVVTDVVRTAVGKMNGSLSEYDEQVLAAIVMKEAAEAAGAPKNCIQ